MTIITFVYCSTTSMETFYNTFKYSQVVCAVLWIDVGDKLSECDGNDFDLDHHEYMHDF